MKLDKPDESIEKKAKEPFDMIQFIWDEFEEEYGNQPETKEKRARRAELERQDREILKNAKNNEENIHIYWEKERAKAACKRRSAGEAEEAGEAVAKNETEAKRRKTRDEEYEDYAW